MKIKKSIISLVFLALSISIQGQIKQKVIFNSKTIVKHSVSRKCNSLDIKNTENILRDNIGRTLKIYMDRDYGYVELMGKKQNIKFNEFKVKKPGNNWLYFLNDIKSEVTRVKYNNRLNKFILTVSFENDRNEIKGKCPSCRIGNDKRAPDINWENPKLKISLSPIAYNGSFTFKVTDVNLIGRFKLNGPTQKFFPTITSFFKSQIRKKMNQQLTTIFNQNSIKNMMSQAFKSEVAKLKLGSVKSIDMSRDNIYLCNYIPQKVKRSK